MKSVRRGERGYNLIEVLIAMAILGVVIMAITALFMWGRKNVYSGKQMTTAISIGTRVLEDLAPLGKDDVSRLVFNIANGTTGTSITYGTPSVTYANSAARSTNPNAISGYTDIQEQVYDPDAEENTAPDMLGKWADQLEMPLEGGGTGERLTDGEVTLIMTPLRDSQATARFGNAALLRLRVIVQWREQQRVRQVILDTVKAN
jgi:prepilin-type N-terminal cleavage/methylation domain-containing protein